jgi:hypothetical protein
MYMRILLTTALILLGHVAWAQNTQDTKGIPDDFIAKMASDLAALATDPHPSAAQKGIPDDFIAKMASDLAALATDPHPSAAQKGIPDDFIAKMASDLAALATDPHPETEQVRPQTSKSHARGRTGTNSSR